MKIVLCSIVAAAALLTACATPPAPVEARDKETAGLLSTAIQRSEALPAGTSSADAKAAPAVMAGKAITINYAGDARDLLKQVAAARGLTFAVRGAQPHLPLFVVVDVKNVSLEEFLAEVGSQFGQRANLALQNRSIEVRYSVQ